MAENGLFKTAMRGFRKEDVLAYIDGLMATQSQQEEAFQAELDTLKQQLAEATVQQEAIRENEALSAEVERLKGQVTELNSQLAQAMAQLEQAQTDSTAVQARDAELAEQLEQAHQATSALWEEKAQLERRLEKSDGLAEKLHTIGETFVRQVAELLPETQQRSLAAAEQPVVIDEPLVTDTPASQMERWLF